MSDSVAKKTLIAKLAEACNAVGGIEKKGRNAHQNYSYVKAADVAKAIRKELFSRKIVLDINETELTQVLVKTISGGVMRYVTLKVEYTLHDGETGEKLGPMGAFATAMDSGDKAAYKAKTGALKYFLRGLGIIPDEKDDPEFDEDVDESTDPKGYTAKPAKPHNKREKIAEMQLRAWEVGTRKTGKTAAQVAIYLHKKFNVASAADLTQEEFNEAMRWATGQELVDGMEMSVEIAKAAKKKTNGQAIVQAIDYVPTDEVAGD